MEFLLVRHAKAADKDVGMNDFDRPLTGKGEDQADRIGRLLAQRELRPDVIVSSPAARALQTAQLAAVGLGIPHKDIRTDARIYEAGPMVLAEILLSLEKHSRPMLVGHNPGFEQLAVHVGSLPSDWEFPKAAAALMQVDAHALRSGGGRLLGLLEPRPRT